VRLERLYIIDHFLLVAADLGVYLECTWNELDGGIEWRQAEVRGRSAGLLVLSSSPHNPSSDAKTLAELPLHFRQYFEESASLRDQLQPHFDALCVVPNKMRLLKRRVEETVSKLAAVPEALAAQSDMIRKTSAMMIEKAETILQMIPLENATVAEKKKIKDQQVAEAKRIKNQQSNQRRKIRQRITIEDYHKYYAPTTSPTPQ
jgi:hypothetical protein